YVLFSPFLCYLTFSLFFFIATATPEIYTLSLHDALPICRARRPRQTLVSSHFRRCRLASTQSASRSRVLRRCKRQAMFWKSELLDRKSTRLNSSHRTISYAVFCLKKKKYNIM